MFHIHAYHNPYLRMGQNTMQAVLSLNIDDHVQIAPAPLSLAIALDQSGSMQGAKMQAAREGAISVVQALDPSMQFVVTAFNDTAHLLFGPAFATQENKQQAIATLKRVKASYGTRMSNALNLVVEQIGNNRTRACKILFLTDGKNEGERHHALQASVERCRATNISINAWGIGTDWDEHELRYMAEATHGNADIIPHPQQIAAAFTQAFQEMRKTAIIDTSLCLWSPVGVTLKNLQQVYPSLAPCIMQPDSNNPRQVLIPLGSFAQGEQRDYLLDLEIPVYPSGQQFLMVRPSVKYLDTNGTEQTEKSTQEGWVFVQWTADMQLAAQIEEHIAHYTHQEDLSRNIQQGQAALAAGDIARATKLLGDALLLSEQSGNEKITRLLSNLVLRDAKGTIRLNPQADAVARKTLAINAGRTSKLK
jgi:Ca-activated chloride channel family protein